MGYVHQDCRCMCHHLCPKSRKKSRPKSRKKSRKKSRRQLLFCFPPFRQCVPCCAERLSTIVSQKWLVQSGIMTQIATTTRKLNTQVRRTFLKIILYASCNNNCDDVSHIRPIERRSMVPVVFPTAYVSRDKVHKCTWCTYTPAPLIHFAQNAVLGLQLRPRNSTELDYTHILTNRTENKTVDLKHTHTIVSRVI